MNTMKTVLLMSVLTVLLVFVGNLLGGQGGMMFAFLIAVAMNFGTYWFSDKIALAMSGAHPVSETEAPALYQSVRELCQKTELPLPRLYVIDSPTPNAVATGRNPQHAAVAVTSGIMHILNRDELEGVLAHELAHVKNRDILISSVTAVIAGASQKLPPRDSTEGLGSAEDLRGSQAGSQGAAQAERRIQGPAERRIAGQAQEVEVKSDH